MRVFLVASSKNWSRGRRYSFPLSRPNRWISNHWSKNWVGSCNHLTEQFFSNNWIPLPPIAKLFF